MKQVFIYGNRQNLSNYVKCLKKLNTKVLISTDIFKAKNTDGLILAGGGDVAPCLYGCTSLANCHDVDMERDIAEQFLIAHFLKRQRPILGICRGLQVINVFMGGTLQKTIETKSVHYNPSRDTIHNTINSGFMKELYGKVATVNSCHKQCILKLGNGLSVSAVSPDGVIEAIENKYLKIIAVQFHPERLGKNGFPVIDKFLSLK